MYLFALYTWFRKRFKLNAVHHGNIFRMLVFKTKIAVFWTNKQYRKLFIMCSSSL